MADLKIEFNTKIENFQLKGKYDYLMKGRAKQVNNPRRFHEIL